MRQNSVDATAPQLLRVQRFSWSGFCKNGIVGPYAPILVHTNQNQWVRAIWNPHPGNTSRRIQWRNSLWSQRSWCLSSRQPAPARLPSLSIISSRFPRRSMSSRHRTRASITENRAGQGAGPAPAVAARKQFDFDVERIMSRGKTLWSRRKAFDRLAIMREWQHGACIVSGGDAAAADPALSCYRRHSCPDLPSLPLSEQRLWSQAAPAKNRRPSLSSLSRSWSSQWQQRANNPVLHPGQVSAPDPARLQRTPSFRGVAC